MEEKHKRIQSATGSRIPVLDKIITANDEMLGQMQTVATVAPVAKVVWLDGGIGSGKELFAELAHQCSGRQGKMVTLNVAGVDDHFFSDTLFGHEKGAYTGADKPRAGMIMRAHEGTLFLDEIGDLSMASQTKLLRLIEYHEYMPLGSDSVRYADVLVVVASHKPLVELVLEGKFRHDLYSRIDTHHIEIPPLRERLDDLTLLIEHFRKQFALEWNRQLPKIGSEVLALLRDYPFPTNVRELKSMMEHALIMANGSINVDALKAKMEKNRILFDKTASPESLRVWKKLPTFKRIDEMLLDEVLRRTGGNQTWAAEMLGITPPAVCKRLKQRKKHANKDYNP